MTDKTEQLFQQLCQHARETTLLQSVEETLGWDERTKMPMAGGEYRADQITHLSGMIHQRQTDPKLGSLLEELQDSDLAADAHSETGATIRLLRREYQKQTKLPQSLVEELTRTTVLGQQAWSQARKENNFPGFLPLVEKIFELKRQQAEAIGYTDQPYDALLDDYEPEAKTADLTRVLGGLRDELAPLVAAIGESSVSPETEILKCKYSISEQERFGKEAAAAIGFDFERGRLDVTEHPFCTTLGPHDCRITTRFQPTFFPAAFFGIMHEAGHGIYEQGLRTDWFGLPPGSYASLGVHESQSRLWENAVGRSREFWVFFYPQAQKYFPTALRDVSLDTFHLAINDVRPSLIRVEADEATYNLHIIIRFELEQAMIAGDLKAADLPGAWNEKYRNYLGIEPPNDASGVLQDIHWSAGLIGYFPTYSLGNLYAAQLFEKADAELGDLGSQFARGDFQPLRNWLRSQVHQPGHCYPASQLVERVTGHPLSHEPLIRCLKNKLGTLYDL